LAASKGVTDITIAQTLPCGLSTIYRAKSHTCRSTALVVAGTGAL
jgi:hypothetical protein